MKIKSLYRYKQISDLFFFLLGVYCFFIVFKNIKTKNNRKPIIKSLMFMNTRRHSVLFIGALLAGSITVHAQSVSLGSNKVTLKHAFEKIEKASKYRIVYNSSLIDTSRILPISKTEGDALELLKLVLQSADYEYDINGNYVTVRPNSTKIRSKSSNINKKKVTGNITDDSGEAIIGATVMVKGTTNAISMGTLFFLMYQKMLKYQFHI